MKDTRDLEARLKRLAHLRHDEFRVQGIMQIQDVMAEAFIVLAAAREPRPITNAEVEAADIAFSDYVHERGGISGYQEHRNAMRRALEAAAKMMQT